MYSPKLHTHPLFFSSFETACKVRPYTPDNHNYRWDLFDPWQGNNYNKRMSGASKKIIVILLLLTLLNCCKKENDPYEHIEPEIKDGITLLKFNNLTEELSMWGRWSAPKLGTNRKFSRALDYPGGGVFFYVPRKERYFVNMKLKGNMPDLNLKINDKSHRIKNKKKVFFVVNEKHLKVGRNRLQFVLDKSQKIAVEKIEIYPKRLTVLKKRYHEGRIFTPAAINFYLNPNKDKKILVQFEVGKLQEVKADIVIQTEKNRRKITKSITNKPINLLPIDNTFHKVSINLPDTKTNYVTLKKSILINRKIKPLQPVLSSFKKIREKNMNLLIMLLDAARADHISAFGYKRKTTPNIDLLARDSVCFTNCFCEAAYTLASTGTFLTGLPPDYHGVISAFYSSLDKKIITLPELFKSGGFFTGAVSANPYFGGAYHFDKGFETFIELFRGEKLVLAEEFIEPFENMLQECRDRPFFIYLHLREPHIDFLMPPPYLGTFQEKYKRQSGQLRQEANEIYFGVNNSEENLRLLTALYDENLLYADAVVGELLAILKKHKIFDNTIKVILSDHGEGLAEHRLIGHNVVLYKEGIHIPLIINIPGQGRKQKFIDKPALTSDLVITLTEIFGLQYPYYSSTSGKNLFTLPEVRVRFCRSVPRTSRYCGYMVDSRPYRLIFCPPYDSGCGELYNFLSDPLEKNSIEGAEIPASLLLYYLDNFINSPRRPKIRQRAVKIRDKDLKNLKSLGYIE